MSFQINAAVENIGARRLHTVIEKLVDDLTFNASDYKGKKYVIEASLVEEKLKELNSPEDPTKYIL